MARRSKLSSSLYRTIVAGVSALAFVFLVSVAATHLHIGADGDDGCAVCAAVVGKLEGPSSPAVAVAPAGVAYLEQPLQSAPRFTRVVLVVLPPSCGPPSIA
jgi:hypothetical protein